MSEQDTPEIFDLEYYSGQCVQAQELLTAAHRMVAQLCAVSTDHGRGAMKTAAHLFGHKEGWVKRLAVIWENWNADDILPHIAFYVYEVIAELAEEYGIDPQVAFRLATDLEYRQDVLGRDDGKGTWSGADLRKYYDAQNGKEVTTATYLNDRSTVSQTDSGLLVCPHNQIPTGRDDFFEAQVIIKERL